MLVLLHETIDMAEAAQALASEKGYKGAVPDHPLQCFASAAASLHKGLNAHDDLPRSAEAGPDDAGTAVNKPAKQLRCLRT